MTSCTNNGGSEWNRNLSDDKAKLPAYKARFSDGIGTVELPLTFCLLYQMNDSNVVVLIQS